MKKSLKLIALMLALVALVSLSACKKDYKGELAFFAISEKCRDRSKNNCLRPCGHVAL